MSMLVTCPNCGPREVQELRCAGETTTRPVAEPTVRELNTYVYFRENIWGEQREWWYCRVCEDWFLAERHTYTNEVARTWHPEPPAAVGGNPSPGGAPTQPGPAPGQAGAGAA